MPTTATTTSSSCTQSTKTTSNALKPKRLSDEFFSADDGSDPDDESENAASLAETSLTNGSVTMVSRAVRPSPPKRFTASHIVRPNAGEVEHVADADAILMAGEVLEASQDIAAAGGAAVVAPQSPPTFDDASPKSATLESAGDVASLDEAAANADVDVRSMDALERREVEEEYRLTGSGRLIKTRRIMRANEDGEEKLPMELINVYFKKAEDEDVSELK